MIRDQLVKALATAVDSAFHRPCELGCDTFTGDPDNAYILLHPMQAARRQMPCTEPMASSLTRMKSSQEGAAPRWAAL